MGMLAGSISTAAVATDHNGDAAVGDAIRMQDVRAFATLGFERLRLPGGEPMGLLGASYVMELLPDWWFGPALYGAATGQRGGLFTWGAEGQRRWGLAGRWQVVAGLYAGGGGGAGAPVGGGLMLRPHVDLMRDFGTWSAGISASQVRFPSGAIDSAQWGLLLRVHDKFAFATPDHEGQSVAFAGVGGLGADRVDVVAGRYVSGTGSGKSLDYVGMRLERQINRVLSATVAAAGAAKGGADGYAEMMAGAAALWPVGDDAIRFGARAAVGLGGGGAVPTGGGPIAKVALSGRLQFNPQVSLELEAGQARAFNGDFNSRYAQLSVGMALADAPIGSGTAVARKTLHDMEWALSLQRYSRAQRRDGGVQALSAMGLKFRRSLSEHVYLSGQAYSAITGGAGAYSAGLLGLGATTRFDKNLGWSVGAEALVGAAGGGGVSSRGGAIAQPMAWVGRDLGRHTRIKVGAGYVKSLRGELSSPVLDLTWAAEFSTP
jgi:hypothetical protein